MKLRSFFKILPVLVSALCAGRSEAAAVVLQDITLGANQETTQWESGYLRSANPTGAASSGVGTAAPLAPGFRASESFYSFGGNFGMTATTSIQAASGFTDIENVVFQRVSMLNPDFSAEENLTFDGTGGPAAAQGGPWLSYFDSSGNLLGTVAPSFLAIVAGSPNVTMGGFTGDVFSFAYQWDLSGIADEIHSVTITAPIQVHSATMEAQIDISSGFTQVIPEPSAVALGCLGACGLLIRRRRC